MRHLTVFTVLIGLMAALAMAAGVAAAGPAVVGGTPAAKGEFPWMVRLSVGCGGSLITNQVVLTAAHCVTSTGPTAAITADLGMVDLTDPDAVRVSSEYVVRAPGYVNYDRGRDWALIKLAEPVDSPVVAIAGTPEHDAGTFTILGWGADREGGAPQQYLLKAQVPAVPDEVCGKAYRDGGVNFVDEAMLCAGVFDTGGVDTCQGDSGGPMVAQTAEGAFVQVGIVSWGRGCAQPQYPGIYTEVSAYASEITAALAELPSTA